MIQLSIIVPIYNVEKYIEECIRSLYSQDVPLGEYEVICVDDCSPDQSASIVERLQKEYPTLKLIRHKRNKKLGGARNTGIKAAEGKYIMFVDSDDMLKPDCLKQLINEMETGHDDFIHFNYVKFYKEGELGKKMQFRIKPIQMTGADMYFCTALPWQQQVSACRKIYLTDFLRCNNLYFVEDTMYEDNDYSMRVAAAAKRCRHLDISPYLYRKNPESVTESVVSVSRLFYWQKTWPIITLLLDTIAKQDARFVDLINLYMRYDLWDVLNNMYKLPRDQRKSVKQNLTVSEWLRYIRFLPIKRRIEYLYKLVKA